MSLDLAGLDNHKRLEFILMWLLDIVFIVFDELAGRGIASRFSGFRLLAIQPQCHIVII